MTDGVHRAASLMSLYDSNERLLAAAADEGPRRASAGSEPRKRATRPADATPVPRSATTPRWSSGTLIVSTSQVALSAQRATLGVTAPRLLDEVADTSGVISSSSATTRRKRPTRRSRGCCFNRDDSVVRRRGGRQQGHAPWQLRHDSVDALVSPAGSRAPNLRCSAPHRQRTARRPSRSTAASAVRSVRWPAAPGRRAADRSRPRPAPPRCSPSRPCSAPLIVSARTLSRVAMRNPVAHERQQRAYEHRRPRSVLA